MGSGASITIPPAVNRDLGFVKENVPLEFQSILDWENMPKTQNDEVTLRTLISNVDEKKDVFLSHEWGKDNSVHKLVLRINKLLQDRGTRT